MKCEVELKSFSARLDSDWKDEWHGMANGSIRFYVHASGQAACDGLQLIARLRTRVLAWIEVHAVTQALPITVLRFANPIVLLVPQPGHENLDDARIDLDELQKAVMAEITIKLEGRHLNQDVRLLLPSLRVEELLPDLA